MIFVSDTRWGYIPATNQTWKPERVIDRSCVNNSIFFMVSGWGGGGGGGGLVILNRSINSHVRQNYSFHCVLYSQGEVFSILA